jgi:hypothetical protein
VATTLLSPDDFAPRYATRFDAELRPVKVRVDLTPVLDAIAETAELRTTRARVAWRNTTREDRHGASWGLAEVTPIRPAQPADDQRKAA